MRSMIFTQLKSGIQFLAAVLLLGLHFHVSAQKDRPATGPKLSIPDERWKEGGVFSGYKPEDELLQFRTEISKTFKNPNGTNSACFVGAVHYKDENGFWQDIDKTILPSSKTGYAFENVKNSFKSYFPSNSSGSILLDIAGNQISFWNQKNISLERNGQLVSSIDYSNVNPQMVNTNELRYNNVVQGLDEQFYAIESGVKYNSILTSKPTFLSNAEQGDMIYLSQTIHLNSGYKVLVDGEVKNSNFTCDHFSIGIPGIDQTIDFGSILIFSESADITESLFEEGLHKSNKKSFKSIYSIQFINNHEIIVRIILPAEKILDPNFYPITVDPTITVGSNSSTDFGYFDGYYQATRNQVLYLSSGLTAAGLSNGSIISATDFYYSSVWCSGNREGCKIRLQQTATSAYTNTSYTNTSYTNCYSGTVTPAVGWTNMPFTSNFTFNSASNLLIDLTMNQSSRDCTSGRDYWSIYATTNRQNIYSLCTSACSDPQNLASGARVSNNCYAKFTYTSATITATSSMTAFTSCPSTASTSQSFTVSGTNMAAGITVTAPAGFEVSTDNSSWSGNGGNRTVGAAGTIASTTVYARMASLASAPANGNIVCSSTGATSVNVAVSGSFFSVPTVTTTTASAVANFTATSGGNVTATGGSSVTARGVLWGISPGLTMPSASSTSNGTGTGSFTSSIAGLSASTIYYYRAYAQNCSGYGYGPEYTFVTTGPSAEGYYISGNVVNNGEIVSTFDENYLRLTGTSKTITGSGKFTNSKLFADGTTTFDAGLVAESAFTETFVNAGKSLAIATGRTFKNGTMANYGTLTITGTGIIENTSNWFNGATGTVTFGGSPAEGTIKAGANWTNDGTFTAGAGTVEFNGSTSGNTINGTTAFYKATINKGTSTATILDVNGTVTQTNSLTFTNGLLRIPTGGSWTKTDFGPTIGANSGLHVNGGTFTQNGASVTNQGMIKVTTGTANFGNSTGNSVLNQSTSTFILDGAGTINVAGRIKLTSTSSFSQSAGTVNVCTIGNGTTDQGSIDLSVNTSFTMSGGAINIVQKSTGAIKVDYRNLAGTVSISGGTLTIGTTATSASSNFNLQGAMPPLVVDNTTNAKTATINGASTVYGNVTINSTSSLVLNSGVTATVNGSLSNSGTYNATGTLNLAGNWVNNGTFTSNAGNEVAFNGTSASTIGGSGSNNFYKLTMNKGNAEVVTTFASALNTVTNELALTSGILDIAGYDLDLAANTVSGGLTSASYVRTSDAGVFKRTVGSSATLFPIGNSAYNPATLTNSGTSDKYSIRVIDNVTDNGTGVGTQTSKALVNRTWMIDEALSGGSNVTLRLNWNNDETINNFAPANAFIAHYVSGSSMWDNMGGTVGDGYVSATGLTSFSPYTVSSDGSFAPLPIELISFQANCANNNTVDITWSTASEHNTNYFRLDKSRDGSKWDVLNTIGAAGNSNNVIDYALTDFFPTPGINYYRLTQYDNDGVFETFDAQAAVCKEVIAGSSLTTYPNPSTSDFNIDLETDELEGEATLMITDAKGAVVHSLDIKIIKGNNNFVIQKFNSEPGMYYITVKAGANTVTTKHSMR